MVVAKRKMSAKDRLIVALDVETVEEARSIFAALKEHARTFKIGSQLFTAAGPTVARAGVEAARLGVSIFNVHAVGGSEMMRRTAIEVEEASVRENFTSPSII